MVNNRENNDDNENNENNDNIIIMYDTGLNQFDKVD